MDNIPVLENETPEEIKSVVGSVLSFISTNGWTILFCVVVANLLWSHFYPKWQQWRQRLLQQQRDSEYHRNPDLLIERQEAITRARQRLQEEHDALARQHAEKAKELEEQKRREKIEQWEKVQNVKLSTRNTTSDSQPGTSTSSLRGKNYNPLMGPGGGSSYRPSRRGGTSGGG